MESQDNSPVVQDSPKYKLWDGLKQKKLYTKSFEDFDKQFSTESAISGLHTALEQRKLYTKSKDDFANQFFADKVTKTKEVKTEIKPKEEPVPEFKAPKLEYGNLFKTDITPIVDQVYNKNTANIVNKEKLTALLPKVKEQKVKDLTIKTLLSENKLSMEGGKSYQDTYNRIMNTIKDDEWMPSWTPTSAQIQYSPQYEQEKINSIKRFAESIGETPEEVDSKIKNGDYEYDYKNNKVLTKGGFGDMAAFGLNKVMDWAKLFIDASAAQERGQQKGNDNELKYVINQYQQKKQNEREFVPYGRSDLEKSFNGFGQTIGEFSPFLLVGPAARAVEVMGAPVIAEAIQASTAGLLGIQNAGSAIDEIINQPGTLDEKVARIKNQTPNQFMLGAMQDAAFRLIHVNDRNSAKELMAQYGPTKNLFNDFKELLTVAPSDAIKAGLVGTGVNVIDNLYKSNEGMKVQWDIPDAFLSGATFELMMKSGHVLAHSYGVLKNSLGENLHKTNPEWFNRYSFHTQEVLNKIVSSPNNIYNKIIEMLDAHPSENATMAKEKIEAFRNHYNSFPSELSKEAKMKGLHILQLKTEALADAQNAGDATLRKSLEKKAYAYDGILGKLLENGNVNEREEPLLLPRYAASINRDDEEARNYGFKDSKDFLESLNRRQGTDFKTFTDIPENIKKQFTSELVPKEQPTIDTTIPDWFNKGEAGSPSSANINYIFANLKELGEFAKKDIYFNNVRTSVREVMNLYKKENLLVNDVRDMVLIVHSSMPKTSAELALQIKAAEQAERLLSYYGDEVPSMSKEQVKSIIEKSVYRGENKYTPEEIEIMKGMVDRLKTDKLFNLSPNEHGQNNFYRFAKNVLKSKEPKSFIHEIGHWSYFNVLTPEERLEFLRYMSNRFGTEPRGRAEELAMAGAKEGKIFSEKTGETHLGWNTLWNFQEYFADQFRQYYYNNVLPEPKLRSLYEKLKDYVNSIIKLFKEKGYNPELTKYFDKIIDVSKVEGEGVPIGKEPLPEQIKQENLAKATPEEIQQEFEKIKQEYDARKSTGGVSEIATRPTGEVSPELAREAKPFRTIEPTDGQLSAIDEWTRKEYKSDAELNNDYGRRGLSRYGQTKEEFIRSRFCK